MSRPGHQCTSCGRTSALKRCSACHKAWYCGSRCQKNDWIRHVLDCGSRPVTTADRLAYAIHRGLTPEDPQTCKDYGFELSTHYTSTMLFELYKALLDPNQLGVKPLVLHGWMLKGTLIENIMHEFDRVPAEKGEYYEWFLQHPSVIIGNVTLEKRKAERDLELNELFHRAWCFIGRSPIAPPEEIRLWYSSISPDIKDCFGLWWMLLSAMIPSPMAPSGLWVKFGFCACTNKEDTIDLARRYRVLLTLSTFEDFCTAYTSSSLATIFAQKRLAIQDPFILDVLSNSPRNERPVWGLKRYVEAKNFVGVGEDVELLECVKVEYGFQNCLTQEEHDMLLSLYNEYFAMGDRANPLALDQACTEGRLFAFFEAGLRSRLKPKKTFRRLLKNPYPLPCL